MQTAHEDIGYEAAQVAELGAYRAQRDTLFQETRRSLRLLAIEAMTGKRSMVPHLEQRANGEVVALCPIAEMLGEVMHLHVVAGALLHILRYSHSPNVQSLRTTIANAYADQCAARMAQLGWAA